MPKYYINNISDDVKIEVRIFNNPPANPKFTLLENRSEELDSEGDVISTAHNQLTFWSNNRTATKGEVLAETLIPPYVLTLQDYKNLKYKELETSFMTESGAGFRFIKTIDSIDYDIIFGGAESDMSKLTMYTVGLDKIVEVTEVTPVVQVWDINNIKHSIPKTVYDTIIAGYTTWFNDLYGKVKDLISYTYIQTEISGVGVISW